MNSLLALALTLGLQAQADSDRIVCVPDADSSGWVCGKGANAPAARPMPRKPRSQPASSPPPYLIDPARLPAVMGPGAYGPAPESRQEPASAEAVATEPVIEAMPARPVPPPAAPEALPQAPAPVTVTNPEPTAPSPATDAAIPAVAEPVAPESRIPSPAPAPAAVNSAIRPAHSISSIARDATELLALAADAYTVQLIASRSFAGYAELRASLGVAVEDTFVIRVRRGNENWWLMLWRDFPDLASARAAAATLKGSYWPRRLAPLQAEVRASPD